MKFVSVKKPNLTLLKPHGVKRGGIQSTVRPTTQTVMLYGTKLTLLTKL